MAEHRSSHQITVVLNAGIPLERLVLDKLHSLSRPTQQQWLRGLLIEGWLFECRLLRLTCGSTQRAALTGSQFVLKTSPMMHRDMLSSTGNKVSASLAPAAPPEMTTEPINLDKPLAYLKRVIG